MSSQQTCSKSNIYSFGEKRQAKLRPPQNTIFKKSLRDVESRLAACPGYNSLGDTEPWTEARPTKKARTKTKGGSTTPDKGKAILAKYIKDIGTENGLPQSLFEQVEDVIRDYCFYEDYNGDKTGGYRPSIRHGERVFIAKGKEPVSWHFNNDYLDAGARVTICFKDGREWVDDCYLDELPVDLLLHILEVIKNRAPLRDARPVRVEEETEAYLLAKEADEAKRELSKNLAGLNVLPHSGVFDGRGS